MPAVELLTRETAPLLARHLFERGDPGPITATLAHVPELMEAVLPFIGAVYGPSSVGERLKEIVILRVSSAHGCRYCVETHSRVAAGMGFSEAEVSALRGDGSVPPGWSPAEQAVFAFSGLIASRPESAVAALEGRFPEHQVVELVTVAATTVFLNRYASALGLPV